MNKGKIVFFVLGIIITIQLLNLFLVQKKNEKEYDFVFVTAFFDIDRKDWIKFNKNNEKYFLQFQGLCLMKIPLVIFIDDRHFAEIKTILDQSRDPK